MKKNVVILMSDEQRWDSLGCNGNTSQVTPNIDRLAEQGISLAGYTPYPLCCPARTSLWTGLLPHNHDVNGNWRSIRPELRDRGLVSTFADAGYHTIYSGKWHVPGTTPHRLHFADASAIPAIVDGRDRGQYIEEYRDYASKLGYDLLPGNISNLTASDVKHLKQPDKAPCGQAEIKMEHFLETWQTTQFIDALERRPQDKPFFAVASYSAPHFPMIVPAPYDSYVAPESVRLSPNFLAGIEGKPLEVLRSNYYRQLEHLNEWEWRRLTAHYLGLCKLIDDQVGKVTQYLESAGLLDNTILVFTSDHGDMLGSHGLNMKGYHLHYEEALKVPLVIVNPGNAGVGSSDSMISLLDLLPTLAELADVQPNDSYSAIDGRSFASEICCAHPSTAREYVVAETFSMKGHEGGSGEHVDTRLFNPQKDSVNLSIRTHRHKYIFRWNDIDELYDLEADPYENVNLWLNPNVMAATRELQAQLLCELESDPALQAHVLAKMEQSWDSSNCEPAPAP